jgi:hypothetical protein
MIRLRNKNKKKRNKIKIKKIREKIKNNKLNLIYKILEVAIIFIMELKEKKLHFRLEH